MKLILIVDCIFIFLLNDMLVTDKVTSCHLVPYTVKAHASHIHYPKA